MSTKKIRKKIRKKSHLFLRIVGGTLSHQYWKKRHFLHFSLTHFTLLQHPLQTPSLLLLLPLNAMRYAAMNSVAVLTILCCTAVVGEDFDPKNTVALTEDNLEEQMQEGAWLVMFWAPWCGHCKRVKPLFAEASEKAGEGVKLGMVDCTREDGKAVCDEMGVHSYPSFRYSYG